MVINQLNHIDDPEVKHTKSYVEHKQIKAAWLVKFKNKTQNKLRNQYIPNLEMCQQVKHVKALALWLSLDNHLCA